MAKARRQSQILQAEKLAAALEAAEKETELMPESDGEQLFEDVEESPPPPGAGQRGYKVHELPTGGKYRMSYNKDVFYLHAEGVWKEVRNGVFELQGDADLPKEISKRRNR